MIAPFRKTAKGWEGSAPWRRHAVEVCIPVIDPMDTLPEVLALLRLQTVSPYIVLIDTGSQPAQLEALEALRGPDVEIHRIASAGQRHASASVAVALDLAVSLCRSECLLMTHQDCFLRRRAAVSALLERLNPHNPVAGYQISPRQIPDWQMMVGHTWTGLHLPTIRQTSARWGFDGQKDFDTEYGFCRALQRCGIVPEMLGTEENYRRNINLDFDHVRSWPSAGLYSATHRAKASAWMAEALSEARQRVKAWSLEPA